MAFDKDAFLTALDSMTVMELNDLVKAIEEKFGVSAAAMATCPACSRVPRANATACSLKSAPRFRMHAKGCGADAIRIVSPTRSTFSCGITAFTPAGVGAPVKMRHADPPSNDGVSPPAALSPRTGNSHGPGP